MKRLVFFSFSSFIISIVSSAPDSEPDLVTANGSGYQQLLLQPQIIQPQIVQPQIVQPQSFFLQSLQPQIVQPQVVFDRRRPSYYPWWFWRPHRPTASRPTYPQHSQDRWDNRPSSSHDKYPDYDQFLNGKKFFQFTDY